MGKNKTVNKFKESIDPRFSGIFNSTNASSSVQQISVSPMTMGIKAEQISDENQGFKDFLGRNLYDYLERNIKEVETNLNSEDLFHFEMEDPCLFSDSNIFQHGNEETVQDEPPKKKKKKKKEKHNEEELFRQVAVTPEWIYKQAQLYNS